MAKPILTGRWMGWAAAAALLCGLLAGCASPGTPPAAAASQPADVAALKQQVLAQQTSIAGLQAQAEAQAALGTQVAAQARRVAALETQVVAAVPTATNTPLPTPTIVPAVAGLVTSGNTKGAASAKVTITEYVDYF